MSAEQEVWHMDFDKLAQWVARGAGRPLTFIIATALVIAWGVSGPIFSFSDTWQLVINTCTTIVTLPDGVPDPEHAEP